MTGVAPHAGRDAALAHVWRLIAGDAPPPAPVRWTGGAAVPLAAHLPVLTMASALVGAYALAAVDFAGSGTGPVAVDAGAVGTAFTSERHLRLNGEGFAGFAPLSRFWPAADGFVRTHANYPHHRARLLAALGVPEADVPARIAALPRDEVAEAVTAAGGLAVAVRTRREWAAHPQGRAVAGLPLLTLTEAAGAGVRPVPPGGAVRVLDLTRVIAGPVGTRALALLGADVLRVDDPRLPEIPAQHLDTGFGKRSTLLDLSRPADRRTFEDLLAHADVLVTGYRPGALDRYGLAPEAVWERYPGMVVARLSAWGSAGPWRDRRGFDSLVQAATGIADIEYSGSGVPGALGAQALDHGTGYLLAAAVLRALAQRAVRGGGWAAELSLAQTAYWLVEGGLVEDATRVPDGPEAHCAETDSALGRLRYALPPVRLPGRPGTWAHPPTPWGRDRPAWVT